jgi:hypothetical protein
MGSISPSQLNNMHEYGVQAVGVHELPASLLLLLQFISIVSIYIYVSVICGMQYRDSSVPGNKTENGGDCEETSICPHGDEKDEPLEGDTLWVSMNASIPGVSNIVHPGTACII